MSAAAQRSKTGDSLHDKAEELSINDVSVEQNEKYLNHLKDIKMTFDEIHFIRIIQIIIRISN